MQCQHIKLEEKERGEKNSKKALADEREGDFKNSPTDSRPAPLI
jgi:hypothetical protein